MRLRPGPARVIVVTVALAGLLGLGTASRAAEIARAAAALTVSSGSWGVVPTTASSGPYSGGPDLVLTFPGSLLSPPGPQYFWAANTGSLPLTGATYSATTTQSVLTLASCSTTWNETNDTCPSGTITTVVTSSTSPAASSVVPAVGGRTRLRASLGGSILSLGTTARVDIAVSRSQVRAATVTTS